MKIFILTVSDRASSGEYEDRSGPAVEAILKEQIKDAVTSRAIVPDEPQQIIKAFESNLESDVILTTGGTGIGPRDVTPDITEQFCDRLVPGIGEYLRAQSLQETSSAVFYRQTAGVKGKTLIINLPGSVRGAEFCTQKLTPVIEHGVKMMHGGGH